MPDEAPVSSRYVRIWLHKSADVPEQIIEKLEIFTEVTRDDRARTTVQQPPSRLESEWQHWHQEVWNALRLLKGVDLGIPFAGVSQTFTVTWDGICRPV